KIARDFSLICEEIENFQEALDNFSTDSLVVENIHPKILKAQKNAISFKLRELLEEVKKYEDLKDGKIIITEVRDLKELPIVLIKARIANGLTQAELAENLGLKEQQIQRYESEKYETASLRTLYKVAETLKISINADVQIKEIEAPEIYDLKKYPFKQMFQRKWFPNFKGSLNEASKESVDLIAGLYANAGIQNIRYAFTKKSVRSSSVFNEFALNAWYARVITKARNQEIDTFFDKNCITESWIKDLVLLSTNQNGPKEAVEHLKSIGIRIIIESQIEGTYLDGAALLMDSLYPVIALTLRYDRIDNFWFVLFHELAHVILHLNADLEMIFDDLDSNIDGIEEDADKFALNSLIPNAFWKKSLVRFSPSEETIKNQAKVLKIHPALVAGRLRRETGKYHLFTDLIGQGQIRSLFTQELNN
ncbi:MAG: helix-turn-helix domain-containing protein, partial [bacterium]